MPTATSTQAGREILTPEAEKILNDRERTRQARLREAAKRADVTTPLGSTPPAFELETLPEPPKAAKPIIVLSTTIAYRGRIVTISNEGMTLDAFCDMLDKRFGAAS